MTTEICPSTPLNPYGQNNYRTLGTSDVKRVAASALPFFMKNQLIVIERAAAANARLSNRARQWSLAQGRRAQRYLTAVEFVLFTPRLVGKNAGVHPAARGIVPLLRSAYPQSAATMRWWIFLDDFVQYGSSSFDAMSDRQKMTFGQTLVRGGYHRPLGADAYTSHGRSSGRLEGSEVYRVTIL
jgi:hypothetical protein